MNWKTDGRKDNYGQNQKMVIPDWELPNVMKMHQAGESMDEIAKTYQVSKTTIKRKIDKVKKWMEAGTFAQRTGKPQEFHNLA